jgi:hypothetical protein
MTDTGQAPKIPWWVRYWTGPTTTRSGLRQEAVVFFLLAAALLGISALFFFWRPAGMGVVVLPVAAGVLPGGFTLAGLWILAAARWIDRHDAWDQLATTEEREAHEADRSLMTRSLPLGLALAAAGVVLGAIVGWVWEVEIGVPAGVSFGTLGGFVLGISLAGFREGMRSGGSE